MSRKQPPAPPAEAFRQSVLDSIDQSSNQKSDSEASRKLFDDSSFSTPTRVGKRQRSQISNAAAAASNTAASRLVGQFFRNATSTANSTAEATASKGFAKPLVRRRSSLFDNLTTKSMSRAPSTNLTKVPETQVSPPSFFRRLSQNSTLMAEDIPSAFPDDASQTETSRETAASINTKPRGKPAGSLFGAVMKKFGSSRKKDGLPPSTPDRKAADPESFKKPAGFMSPSGKSIMNVVNQFVMNSPFRFQSPKAKRRLSEALPSESRGSVSTPSPARKRRRTDSTDSPFKASEDSQSSLHNDENWREAPISRGQAEILDWTLKESLRLECHPPEALESVVHSREWLESLSYWQYPPNDSISYTEKKAEGTISGSKSKLKRISSIDNIGKQKSLSKDNTTGPAETSKMVKGPEKAPSVDTSAKRDPAMQLASKLIRSVRGEQTTISRNLNKPIPGEVQRNTEWQQAFRSLYMNWCNYTETLEEKNAIRGLLDHYFYSIGDDHIALFRLVASGQTDSDFTPQVVVTSSGESFLQALRDTGVTKTRIVEDVVKLQAKATALSPKRNIAVSPTVKADLEALRKAQAYGEVAGADVSVKFKANKQSKTESLTKKPQNFAVTISGYDDVDAFFEVYLNKMGKVREETYRGLPKLVCPSPLGPFWHASQKVARAFPAKPPKASRSSSTPYSSPAVPGTMEVEGLILPGMVRQIIALAASKLVGSLSDTEDRNPLLPIQSPSKGGRTGSHYVVLHTMEEPSTKPIGSNPKLKTVHKTMTERSVLLNAADPAQDSSSLAEGPLVEACQDGMGIQLMVWEASRRNVVACKIGSVSTDSVLLV